MLLLYFYFHQKETSADSTILQQDKMSSEPTIVDSEKLLDADMLMSKCEVYAEKLVNSQTKANRRDLRHVVKYLRKVTPSISSQVGQLV